MKKEEKSPVIIPVEQAKNIWFTEDETDEAMGIETMHYDNGGVSKKCVLKDGRIVHTWLLNGKDRVMLKRITNGDSSKVQDAIIALSTTINDKALVIEDIDELWFNDLTKIQTMASSINFM